MISKTNLIKLDFKKRRPIYETTSMQYDVFGNLVKHGKISYKIDPLNKRLARLVDGVTTNMYAYNPEGQMIAELDQNGRLSKYFVYGSKSHVPDYFIDSNNEKFKIITDHLGSVRYVVNSSTGEVKLKMNHDEFGKVLVDTNPNYLPFGFAGGIYDSATGLVRFGVRDYDPETGRWLSKDPIRFDGGDTNLYGYVLQDPINKIDPPGTGPVAGITCYVADAMYAGGELLASLINYSSEINAYQQQINNIQQQLNNIPSGGNSCDKNSTERSRLNGQLDILSRQKNLALGQLTNELTGIGGGTLAGGIICTGLLALPIP